MVVQVSFEAPSPSTAVLESNLAPKKYVIVKNHVRELRSNVKKESRIKVENKHSGVKVIKQKVPKRKRKISNCTDYEDNATVLDEKLKLSAIDKNDLDELRSVYLQCKSVVEKIEHKYGHLLNLSNPAQESGTQECNCDRNKKIIFDEQGKQIVKYFQFDNHICFKNHKQQHSSLSRENANIQIEHEHDSVTELPDSLNELGDMLKDPNIEASLQSKVINKIRCIRHEYMNELKFDKQTLLEKLKMNPEDILKFKGTNLSTLSGYLV